MVGQVLGTLRPLLDELEVVAEALSGPEHEVVTSYLRSVTAVMQHFAARTSS